MKTIIIILLGVALYSCGSDNPVTNSVNPTTSDTVTLFTKDSIYAGSPYQGRDSVEYYCTVNVDTLHCQFNLYSQNVLAVQLLFNSYDTLINLTPVYNQDYHLKLAVNSANFNAKLFFALAGATGSSYYASIRNINLWYIK